MKNVFILFALVAILGFSGCSSPTGDSSGGNNNGDDNGSGNNNSDVVGTWTCQSEYGDPVTLEIGASTWTFIDVDMSQTGSWSRNENILTFRLSADGSKCGTATLAQGKLILSINYNSFNAQYTLTKNSPSGDNTDGDNTDTTGTTLKIKNESFSAITDVKWQNVAFGNAINYGKNSIENGSSVTKNVSEGTGYIFFTRETNPIVARTKDTIAVEKGKAVEFVFTDNTLIVEIANTTNTGTFGSLEKKKTALKIKNESFSEITDVIWQDVTFANNTAENSIKTGTTVTQEVKEGQGYIYFKRKTNPIAARTKDLVIIEKDEAKEFVFDDNTPIVEKNNAGNSGTLGSLGSTVLFFDDAEGEMQQYYKKQSFVGYYADVSDLGSYSYSYYLHKYHPPKNGKKSIAVGGTNTALLQVKINLSKKAKLSFWYANKYYYNSGTTFSINSAVKETWTTDMDWAFLEFDLEAGENNLAWEKKDGFDDYNGYFYYLSLDDILIYYTE